MNIHELDFRKERAPRRTVNYKLTTFSCLNIFFVVFPKAPRRIDITIHNLQYFTFIRTHAHRHTQTHTHIKTTQTLHWKKRAKLPYPEMSYFNNRTVVIEKRLISTTKLYTSREKSQLTSQFRPKIVQVFSSFLASLLDDHDSPCSICSFE